MAESQEDLEEHTHQSVIRGHHIYKDIWSPYIGEHLTLQREDSNTHDRHAVCLMKDNCAVGHVPRELSRVVWYFLCHGGRVTCEVTGRRKRGKGLEVPCAHKFVVNSKHIKKLIQLLSIESISNSCPV